MPLSPLVFLFREQYTLHYKNLENVVQWLRRCKLVRIEGSDKLKEFVSSGAYFSLKILFLAGSVKLAHSVFSHYKRKTEFLEHASEINFILETNKKVILSDLTRINPRFAARKPDFTSDSLLVDSQWQKNAVWKCFDEKGELGKTKFLMRRIQEKLGRGGRFEACQRVNFAGTFDSFEVQIRVRDGSVFV